MPTTTSIPEATEATLAFPKLNEFAFVLFNRWLYGAQLSGPSDFRTMQHYLGLYVLAIRFQIEKLQNEIMDLARVYYKQRDGYVVSAVLAGVYLREYWLP